MNTSEALKKIFYRPREVFAELKQDRKGGQILLILVAIALADMTLNNFSSSWHESVDLQTSTYHSDVLETSEPDEGSAVFRPHANTNSGTDASADVVEIRFGVNRYQTGDGFPSVVDVIMTFFGFAVALLIEAVYLRIVSSIMGLEIKIDQWFALVAYSRIPGDACVLLITAVLTMALFISSEVLGLESAVLTRLILGSSSTFPSIGFFLDFRNLAEIWVIALLMIGFRDWSGKSILVSLAIVIAPTVLLYGVMWWLVS